MKMYERYSTERGNDMKGFKKESMSNAMRTGIVLSLLVAAVPAMASAEENLRGFSLDQMTVTATRLEKRDIDVPASTVVLTQQDIKETGGTNAAMVLQKVQGFAYKSFGPSGSSMGTMINEAIIRGVDNGTLVLVNGSPISWRGKYNLEAISSDDIQRIEIVKGGGSVLYGSEAMGGVINIITKKKADNYVKAGMGNYGHKEYGVSAGTDKVQVRYNKEKWDHVVDRISESDVKTYGATKTSADAVSRDNLSLNYNITENLDMNYNYMESKVDYLRDVISVNPAPGKAADLVVGTPYNDRTYTTKQHITQLNYRDDSVKAEAYFNSGTVESFGHTWYDSKGKAQAPGSKNFIYNTREKNRSMGYDVQKKWEVGDKAEALLGTSLMHEKYSKLRTVTTSAGNAFSRNVWGVYGQWDQKLDDRTNAIVSARETWTTGAADGQNYSNFSMAGQVLHKLDDTNSIYLNVGQSFIMPTFAQMYPSNAGIENPDLKPQKGVQYEIGWKKIAGAHNWKAAIYKVDITDNISATWSKGLSEYQYNNEDFKNTGIEIGDTVQPEGNFSYQWAVGLNNPKVKNDKKGYWDRKYGRYQITGGVGYHQSKFQTYLSGSFLGDRVQTPSAEHSFKAKPYFLTTLTSSYAPDKDSTITLTIDNVLDRKDSVGHSSGTYYSTPRNFLLEYKYKF